MGRLLGVSVGIQNADTSEAADGASRKLAGKSIAKRGLAIYSKERA